MNEIWLTNRDMIIYRLHGVLFMIKAQRHDSRINVTSGWSELGWCQDTRDYVVSHGTGLGPYEPEVDKMLNKVSKALRALT